MAQQWDGLDWKSRSRDLSLSFHYIITCLLAPYSFLPAMMKDTSILLLPFREASLLETSGMIKKAALHFCESFIGETF